MAGSLRIRLDRLEARRPEPPEGDTLIAFQVLLRTIERYRAERREEDLPAYSPEEQAAMHEEDLQVVAGGGVVGWLRDSGGWDSPESREFLAGWEEDARRRVAAM